MACSSILVMWLPPSWLSPPLGSAGDTRPCGRIEYEAEARDVLLYESNERIRGTDFARGAVDQSCGGGLRQAG